MSRQLQPARAALAAVFAAVAALAFAAPALAHPGRAQELRPLDRIPANRPAAGLVYDGLELAADGVCRSAFRVKGGGACTHGPDAAPAGVDIKVDAPPIVSPLAPAPSVQCDGDGTSGKRVQVLYVRASDRPDRYGAYLNSIRRWAADADWSFRASAGETSGERHIRYVHDADCVIDVPNVVLTAAGDDDFFATRDELVALGYDRTDRKYMLFVDANVYCGLGEVWGDDSAGAANLNNGGPSYGRTDTGCWDNGTPAHELMHNLGGVQLSAPNSSGGWHCTDEWDLMCYSDYPNYPELYYYCTDQAHDLLFDCRHDDYFHTSPPAGSYLATHWNTASSGYLVAGPQPVWGYVWSNDATSASSTPSPQYQRNSTGGISTLIRQGTGVYQVRFKNLGVYYGGTVNVTAYGTGAAHCKTGGWTPSLADQLVTVYCFDAAGALADSRFTATFTRPITSTRFGYVWASTASPPLNVPTTPSLTYQFNSTGAANTITRAAVGAYTVRLPGLGGPGGTVTVTGYGSSSDSCKVNWWSWSGAEALVSVRCQNAAGAAADEQFTLTFHGEVGILGVATDAGYEHGYAWADQEAVASYTPSPSYSYNSDGNTNTATRSSAGVYQVQLPGLGTGGFFTARGHVQVTAYGSGPTRCKVQSWGSTVNANVNVLCFDAAGAPADSRFVVDYVD
jgi:hypothetical protein